MDHIAQRRKDLNLSQLQLATPYKVGRQCVSDIEGGLYLPSPELAAVLQTKLITEGLSDSSQILTPRVIRRLVTLRPFDLPAVNKEPWERMHKSYPKQVRALKVNSQISRWIERNLESECGTEGIGWFSLAAQGARGFWASPPQLGYRHSSLLDSQGKALGERLLPGLRWVGTDFEALIWPQPRLLGPNGTFRPDALMLARVESRAFWRGLEIDGASHRTAPRSTWDKERERLLGLELIRFPTEQVLRLELPLLLAQAIRSLVPGAGRVA